MSTSSSSKAESSSLVRSTQAAPKGIGDLVTFLVGPDKVAIQIHKKILCHHSPILDTAFNSTFFEGKTQTYELESVTEDTFALFTEWIYSQKLERTSPSCDKTTMNTQERADIAAESASLVALWILADMLLIPRLQNQTIDIIAKIGREVVTIQDIIDAYANTAIDSPLRKLFVSQLAWVSPESSELVFSTHGLLLPKQFVLDVVLACQKIMIHHATVSTSVSACISQDAAEYYVKED
ncbi:hypothetical protein VTL71DRAFT_12085 [Oculimacula yallundae]|uniref:BTB domain-containing protein n=1 Tax=Oculimacula yallundae TaxID=86028 RepID=A0ABR4CSJ0_9HELO